MKTVVISGYYGYENIGDEALLASIVSALKAELPDINIIVLSASPEQTAKRYNVQAVSRLNLFSVFSALKDADLLISGGGSLLQDVTGPLTIPYYLGVVTIAKLLGKPVMFYAQGVGPVNRGFSKMLIRFIADKVDMITLRDSASGHLLSEIGIHNPPVEITADPVFGMNIDDSITPTEIYTKLGIAHHDKPTVGLFIREWQGLTGYKKALAGLADTMSDRGWQVMFIPMQYLIDVAPAQQVAAMMKTKPLIIDQGLSLAQLTSLVNSLDLVIAMRLHALIIASLCAVPMVGISYDPKVSEFMESTGQPLIKDLDSATADHLIQKVDQLIQNSDDTKVKLQTIKNDLRKKALRNSQIAVELLNRKVKL